MPPAGRLSASILDGETETELDEYNAETTGTKTECWVESKEGSRFSIKVSVAPIRGNDQNMFRCSIYADGMHILSPLLGDLDGTFYSHRVVYGAQEAEGYVKPFTFAKTYFTGTALENGHLTVL